MAELFEITGLTEVMQRLQQMAAEVTPLLGIALQQEADAILEASQPLVPVDTGALKASGTVADWSIRGPVVETSVSYGGTGPGFARRPEEYAAIIEFDVTMNHPRGGQAGYLSQPTFAAVAGMAQRLADAVRLAL